MKAIGITVGVICVIICGILCMRKNTMIRENERPTRPETRTGAENARQTTPTPGHTVRFVKIGDTVYISRPCES